MVVHLLGLLCAVSCQHVQDEGVSPHDARHHYPNLHWDAYGMLRWLLHGRQYRVGQYIQQRWRWPIDTDYPLSARVRKIHPCPLGPFWK